MIGVYCDGYHSCEDDIDDFVNTSQEKPNTLTTRFIITLMSTLAISDDDDDDGSNDKLILIIILICAGFWTIIIISMICVYAVNKKKEFDIRLKKIELDIVKNKNNTNNNIKKRFSNFKFQKHVNLRSHTVTPQRSERGLHEHDKGTNQHLMEIDTNIDDIYDEKIDNCQCNNRHI